MLQHSLLTSFVNVAKALELFMISLVTKSALHARSRSSKKVTATHLKQIIQQDEQFDFLADIVAKVPDAPEKKRKEEERDSDEMGEGDGGKERKKRAPRRKRTAEEEL